eukprot:scaffold5654_cov119-Isochrysis_galbana.AAC.9
MRARVRNLAERLASKNSTQGKNKHSSAKHTEAQRARRDQKVGIHCSVAAQRAAHCHGCHVK